MGAALCDEAPNLEIKCTPAKHLNKATIAECPGEECGGAGKKNHVCRSCAFLSEVHEGKLVCRACHEREIQNRKEKEQASSRATTPPTTRANSEANRQSVPQDLELLNGKDGKGKPKGIKKNSGGIPVNQDNQGDQVDNQAEMKSLANKVGELIVAEKINKQTPKHD